MSSWTAGEEAGLIGGEARAGEAPPAELPPNRPSSGLAIGGKCSRPVGRRGAAATDSPPGLAAGASGGDALLLPELAGPAAEPGAAALFFWAFFARLASFLFTFFMYSSIVEASFSVFVS